MIRGPAAPSAKTVCSCKQIFRARRLCARSFHRTSYLSNGAFHLSFTLDKQNQLNEALRDAFDPDEFDLMLSSRVGKQQNDIVGQNDDYPRVVWEVVDNARRYNWLRDLIKGAAEQNPGNDKLQKFIGENPEYKPQQPPPPPPPGSTPEEVDSMAAALLKTLQMLKGELLNNAFQNILDKIDILSDYKVLHDGLHDITFIFSLIDREVGRLPDGEAKTMLGNLDGKLREKIEPMRDTVNKNKVELEELEWVNELEAARKGLKAAVKDYDKDLVTSHKQVIESVLQTRPSKINKILLRAIYSEKDRLPELVGIMRRVRDAMKGIKSEEPNVRPYEEGITSLESLTSQLKSLVEEHDTWQEVEGDLKQISDWLETDLSKFSKKWETQRARIKIYYSGQEEWATDFQQDDVALEAVLTEGTAKEATPEVVAKARTVATAAFNSYYAKARLRFYAVDKLLLNSCQTLTKTRKNLP